MHLSQIPQINFLIMQTSLQNYFFHEETNESQIILR